MIKDIPLSLATNYVSSWTVEDAARELIQNALDTENYDIYTEGDELHIHSFGGTIPEEYLLLGGGNKADNDSCRGGFSEGFKLAFLILAREGIEIFFQNGDVIWKPVLKYSELFNKECLHVEVYEAEYPDSGVSIKLSGLSEEQIQNIENRTLVMQEDYQCHRTPYGEILLEDKHRGKVYVGGLFVDKFESDYGFNFNPEDFELDRDRRSMKPFDIQWMTKDMWASVARDARGDTAKSVVDTLLKADMSTQYMSSSSIKPSQDVKVAAEEVYVSKYEGSIVSSSYTEVLDLQKAGNNAVYVDNESLVKIIRETDAHKTVMLSKKNLKTVPEMLEEWKDKWYDSFESDMLYDFEDLISEIEKRI